MLGPVNDLMRRRRCPEVGLDTRYNDFARLKEIQAEERQEARGAEAAFRQSHIDELMTVIAAAWDAYNDPSNAVSTSRRCSTPSGPQSRRWASLTRPCGQT